MNKKKLERKVKYHTQNLQHQSIEISNIRKVFTIILKKLEEEDLIRLLRVY